MKTAKRAHHKIRVAGELRKDLDWWLEFAEQFNGTAPILGSQAPMCSTYSDSSTSWGYGVIHGPDWVTASWEGVEDPPAIPIPEHHWGEVPSIPPQDDNINVLELWPIVVAVERWGDGWENRTVCMVSDNTQVVAALRTGRSTNKTSMEWLRRIFWRAVEKNMDIKSVYIRSEDNEICDSLSRLSEHSSVGRINSADKGGYMCCANIFSSLQDGSS